MKHLVEITHDELVELLSEKLGIQVSTRDIKISAICADVYDASCNMLQVKSISLSWDEGKKERNTWDR